ncbi:hypothetical protein DQE82_29590 [Micromonospora sp. LHW51205]|uniref:hypothetical protein n=1 Tax=Micromonospora sp. LHW51205 TaxID=2248752 RepID=UPI000DE87272|nr:hypothetical protein [Micromonospora sp. LHW51205]RBQ03890.1 hypothetical protein DQE82_29590 [Micromonospora sp. LHW51205]
MQALAWPSVALVVLLVYRRRFARLLGDNLRRLKAGPIEAEWEKAAEEARATIEAAETLPAVGGTPQERAGAMLKAARIFIEINPPEAVRLGWNSVAWELDALAEREMGRVPGEVHGLRQTLLASNPGASAVLERLRRLRNVGMHQPEELTSERAQEFVDLVEDFLTLLSKPRGSDGGTA